jgi:hypothetical protein
MVLVVIYWLLIILALCSRFAPDPLARYLGVFDLVLFIILGIKVFGLPT